MGRSEMIHDPKAAQKWCQCLKSWDLWNRPWGMWPLVAAVVCLLEQWVTELFMCVHVYGCMYVCMCVSCSHWKNYFYFFHHHKGYRGENGDAQSFIMCLGQWYRLNCTYLFLNLYVKTLAPNVTVFGDGTYRRWVRFNVRSWVGSFTNKIGSLIRRRRRERDLFPCHILKKGYTGSKKAAGLQAGKRAITRN